MTWLPRDPSDVGLDPSSYTDGQVPVKDAAGGFVPGAGGTLSDADPAPLGDVDAGVAVAGARGDHVHPRTSIDQIVGLTVGPTEPAAPQNGWVWFDTNTNTVKVRVSGVWVIFGTASEGTARITEAGDDRLTEDGATRLLEGV